MTMSASRSKASRMRCRRRRCRCAISRRIRPNGWSRGSAESPSIFPGAGGRVRIRVGKHVATVRLPAKVGLEPLRNRYRRGDASGPTLIPPNTAYRALAPYAVLGASGHRFWALATLRAPILVLPSDSGIRVEPFSGTSLREWDDLVTVGRFDISDPSGLVKRLDGNIPDGSAEDFGLLALAAAYAEYSRQDWSGLKTIIGVMEGRGVHYPDLELLKLAADIADKGLVGYERRHAIARGLFTLLQLPVLRWGVMLFADLVKQADMALPAWVNALDLTSVVTLINQSGLAALGFDPEAFALRTHSEPQNAITAREVETKIPVWLQGNERAVWQHLVAIEGVKMRTRAVLTGSSGGNTSR